MGFSKKKGDFVSVDYMRLEVGETADFEFLGFKNDAVAGSTKKGVEFAVFNQIELSESGVRKISLVANYHKSLKEQVRGLAVGTFVEITKTSTNEFEGSNGEPKLYHNYSVLPFEIEEVTEPDSKQERDDDEF